MEALIIRVRQAPNTPGVYEQKMDFKNNWGDCIKIRKVDGEYWYVIDTSLLTPADIDSIARDIRGIISEEDYHLYFEPKLPNEALDDLTKRLRATLKDAAPVGILADVSFMQKISSGLYLLELTCGEGTERIRAIATAEQCGHHIVDNTHKVFVTGRWSIQKERGIAEFIVDALRLTNDFVDTDEILSTQKKMIRFYEGQGTKRKPFPIESQIATWETLAVLTNEAKTAEDFTKILEAKKSPLACKTIFVRFSDDALSYKIQEIGKDAKYSAICIVKGQPRDRYTFLPLNSYKIYEAIGETKIPVLVGVGRDEDHPYGLEAADFIASTYSALAIQIATWQQFKRYEKSHGLLSNFFGFFRKCLPW